MIIPNLRTETGYSENAKVYLSDEMKNKGQYCMVKIGMRRKGIAIASDDKNLYIINYKNLVVFKTAKEGVDYNGKAYNYSIKRSITGHYVVIWSGYAKITNVGKDDTFYSKESYEVYDENGVKLEQWQDEEVGLNKYPMELGCGMIAWENNVYQIESLQLLFTIPHKFTIISINQNGLIYLSATGDLRKYAIIVRAGKIIEQHNIEKIDEIMANLSSKEKQYEKDMMEKNGIDYADALHKIEYGELLLNKYGSIYYSNLQPFPDFYRLKETICHSTISKETFSTIEQLDEELVKRLRAIHIALKRNSVPKVNSTEAIRYMVFISEHIKCFFYLNAYILEMYTDGKYMFRFFDIDGHSLSSQIYESPFKNKFFLYKDKEFNRNLFIVKGQDPHKQIIIHLSPNKFVERELPHNIRIEDIGGYLRLMDSNMKYTYCDYDLNELPIKYISCHVEEKIRNYLYRLSEPFLDSQDYDHGYWYDVLKDGRLVMRPIEPKKIFKNGVLLTPIPLSYENCIDEIKARHKNRPNYVADIEEIKSYTLEEGKTYLYKFVCCPWTVCDTNGLIDYSFNVDNIDFVTRSSF